MTLPLIYAPGHMCDISLYAPQIAELGPPTMVADTAQDTTVRGMAERLLVAAPERFVVAGLSMGE